MLCVESVVNAGSTQAERERLLHFILPHSFLDIRARAWEDGGVYICLVWRSRDALHVENTL